MIAKKTKILLVEDSRLHLKMLEDTLRRSGYDSLVTAANGVEAINKVYQEKPDLILLDVMLPKMSGYEVCRVLKSMAETRGLPVIMVTAKEQKIDKLWGKTTGADGYITKPFEPAELLARIRSLMAKHSRQIETSKELISQTELFKKQQTRNVEKILSKANEILDQNLFEAYLITEINRFAHFKYSYEEVARAIMDVFYKAIDYEVAGVVFGKQEGNSFIIHSRNKLSAGFRSDFKKRALKALPEELRASIKPEALKDKYLARESHREDPVNEKITSFFVSPVKNNGHIAGALVFASHLPGAYDEYKQKVIGLLTRYGGIVIENALWLDERKKMEEKAMRLVEAAKWETTFDSIRDFVSIRDRDFKIIKMNKAFAGAFNKKPQDFVGQTCYKVIHGRDKPLRHCPHQQTMETSLPARTELFASCLNIHLEVSTTPIFDKQGKVTGSVYIAKDITERKRSESERKQMQVQLIRSQKMEAMGQLAAGVAHEVNNPLTVVRLSVDALQQRLKSDGYVLKKLGTMRSEINRARKITQSLLAFSHKKSEEKKTLTDLNNLVELVMEPLEHQLKVNNIEIVKALAKVLPKINFNANQIQQVLLKTSAYQTETHSISTDHR